MLEFASREVHVRSLRAGRAVQLRASLPSELVLRRRCEREATLDRCSLPTRRCRASPRRRWTLHPGRSCSRLPASRLPVLWYHRNPCLSGQFPRSWRRVPPLRTERARPPRAGSRFGLADRLARSRAGPLLARARGDGGCPEQCIRCARAQKLRVLSFDHRRVAFSGKAFGKRSGKPGRHMLHDQHGRAHALR